jgi:hypothetical protein
MVYRCVKRDRANDQSHYRYSAVFLHGRFRDKKSGDPASYSFVLRGYVRHWLDTVWAEYDRVSLTDIVEAKESPAPPVGRLRPVMKVAEAT